MVLKRKRNSKETVVQSFEDLRNVNEARRVASGTFLVKTLNANIQKGDESPELEYVVKRLVHGIGSPRPASCAGYFSVLVALLSAVPTITVDKIRQLLRSELAVSSKFSKSEEADTYTGQILVLGALIRSGRFLNEADGDEQQEILSVMLKAGEQRSYLRLAAYTFILELVKQVDAVGFREVVWPIMLQEVDKPLQSQSFEGLYFLLVARRIFPEVVSRKFLLTHVGCQDLLHEDTILIWGQLLLEAPAAKYVEHPVYEELGKQLASSPLLPQFWCEGVEPWLRASNINRQQIILRLFTVIVENITNKTNVSKLLTPYFFEFFLNHLKWNAGQNAQLAEQAGNALALIVNTLSGSKNNDAAILAVLEKLLFYPGTLLFEKVTGTRVVQILSGELTVSGVKELVQLYQDVVMGMVSKDDRDGRTVPFNAAERVYAAQLLTRLMCSQVMQMETEWKVGRLKLLLQLSMFQTEQNYGHQLVETLRSCFFKVLDQRPKATLPRLNSVRNSLSAVVHHANKMLESKGVASLRRPWTEKVYESWKLMMKVVKKMNPGKEDSKLPASPVFHTMFLQMGLQLFAKPDVAMEALQELHSCYKEVGRSGTRTIEAEDDVQWVDVAVDLMLSLLSRNTHLLRNVVGWVFPHLCPFLTPLSLDALLQVLDPSSEENPLLDSSSADEGDGDFEEGSGDAEDSSSGDDTDADTDVEEPVDAELQAAVRDALGTAGTLTDTESVDLDELGEEEGNRLNEVLSKAFQQLRRPGKGSKAAGKKQTRKDRALTHFRIRVLDLVEIYAAAEPSLGACVQLFPPLFRLLAFCIQDEHQRPLENRVRACISKLAKLRRCTPSPDVVESQLAEVASSLLEKGDRKATVLLDMNTQVMDCCMFLVRASHQLHLRSRTKEKKKKKGSPLTEVLRNVAAEFFRKRDTLVHPRFFQVLTQQLWFGNWSLLPLYVECCFDPAVRVFKRSQAVATVMSVFSSRMVQQEFTHEEKECLSRVEKSIIQNSLKMLREAAASSGTVKDKFVGELAQLAVTVWNSRARQSSGADWRPVGLAFVEYARSVQNVKGSVKNAINRLSSLLKLEVGSERHQIEPKAKMRKVETEDDSAIGTDSSGSDRENRGESEDQEIRKPICETQNPEYTEGNENIREKRKKSKRKKAQLKKESKLLRAAAASDGLASVSFSNLDVSSVVEDPVSSEETEGTSTKFISHLRKSKKRGKT